MNLATTSRSEEPPARPAPYRAFNAAAFLLFATVLLLLHSAEVSADPPYAITLWNRPFPHACIIREMTGKDCPGCGMTRALATLLKGQVERARTIHPSVLWVAAWLGTQLLVRLALAVGFPSARRFWCADLVLSATTLTAAVLGPIVCQRLAISA